MTERITSSTELRSFVADNTGRRKLDAEASLELHIRAAKQLDMLSQQVADMQARLSDAGSPSAAQAPPIAAGSDASESAMMLLRNAQTAADQTLAEASQMRSDAASTLQSAESDAQAQADAALEGARAEARSLVDAAEVEAAELVTSSNKAVDRARFIERQYIEKAGAVRREAEALVDFSRQVESLADSGIEVDSASGEEPASSVLASPPPPPAAPALETQLLEAPLVDAVPEAPVVEAPPLEAPVVEAPPLEAPVAEPAEVIEDTLPASQFLPPPPPPSASDILDLTEAELDEVIGDESIDDELFGDDVIDVRDGAQERA